MAGAHTSPQLTASAGGSIISIGRPLNQMHWGDPLDAGIDGRIIYQTAEVGLLTRHILINGVREVGNFSLEGEALLSSPFD